MNTCSSIFNRSQIISTDCIDWRLKLTIQIIVPFKRVGRKCKCGWVDEWRSHAVFVVVRVFAANRKLVNLPFRAKFGFKFLKNVFSAALFRLKVQTSPLSIQGFFIKSQLRRALFGNNFLIRHTLTPSSSEIWSLRCTQEGRNTHPLADFINPKLACYPEKGDIIITKILSSDHSNSA